MLDRIVQGTGGMVSVQLTKADGDAADVDTASVVITDDTGATVAAGDADAIAGVTGGFEFIVPPADTPALAILDVAWTATIDSHEQTVHTPAEVCGGVWFTVPQARARTPLGDTARFPARSIVAARTLAEQALEDACQRAFVPRRSRARLSGTGRSYLTLPRGPVRRIAAVTVDGTALTNDELAAITVEGRRIYRTSCWTAGRDNVSVIYEHGLDHPPEDGAQVAIVLAKRALEERLVDERTTQVRTDMATISFAAENGRFGIPDVDAFVERYPAPSAVALA